MRVFNQHPAGFAFHAANAPRAVAEQHDVARVAFNREIFVERADDNSIRLRDHREQSSLRNGSATGDGSQPAAAAGAQFVVHPITMEISAVAPSPGSNSFRKHFKNRIVTLARQITVRVRTLDENKQFIFIPTGIVLLACRGHPRPRIDFIDLAGFRNEFEFRSRVRRPRRMVGCASRDNLLGQNVQRRFRNHQAIQLATAYTAHQRSTLQQVVARGGEESSLGNSAAPVPRAANPLQSYRNGARRADLNNQIDRADVDSEFERCRRDQNFNLSFFELLLRGQAQLAGQTSMMRGNVVFTQPLCQMMRHALDQPARVDEYQR